MTVTTAKKRFTQKDVDAMYDAFNARIAAKSKSYRDRAKMDPETVLAKIASVEAILMPHFTKEAAKGWYLEGWDIQPDPEAFTVWPITAKIHFRHERLIGYDASLLWAETGSEECFEWLKAAGFPIGGVNVNMY